MSADGAGLAAQLELAGYRALIADHCRLSARVEKLERIYREMLEDHVTLMHQVEATDERLSRLEFVVSEELMINLTRPRELREVVAELGAGWRIEREPVEDVPCLTVS